MADLRAMALVHGSRSWRATVDTVAIGTAEGARSRHEVESASGHRSDRRGRRRRWKKESGYHQQAKVT